MTAKQSRCESDGFACIGPWSDTAPDRDTPDPFHAAADLDRASLVYARGRGIRSFLLVVSVASAVISAALLVLVAVLWGAS